MIGAGRSERRQSLSSRELTNSNTAAASVKWPTLRSPLEMRLRMAGRSFAATSRRSARGRASTRWPPKDFSARVLAEPSGGSVDHLQRGLVAILRGRPPGEQAVAAKHHPFDLRIGLGHRAELQTEVKPGTLPWKKTEFPTINLSRQLFGVLAGRDCDDSVGVNVVDVRMRNEAVQRGIDRGCARVEVERAVIVERNHLVLVLEAAIDRAEAEQLIEIERRETVELHRADVAAGALDPKDIRRRAGQRIRGGKLGRGVAAAEIGDAQVASEQIGSVEQQPGPVEGSRALVVPQVRQRSVQTQMIAAHGGPS